MSFASRRHVRYATLVASMPPGIADDGVEQTAL